MPTVHLPSELLQAVNQLNSSQLEELAREVFALRSRQMPRSETSDQQLLDRINRPWAEDSRKRFDELAARRDHEVITPEELVELKKLTTQAEQLAVVRVQALCELAQRREMTVSALADQLGIQAPSHE